MRKKITILEKFQMSDWRQMDRFIATTHGENHVLRNRALFDWFFLRCKTGTEANLIVAYEDDKLISLLGYLPTRFLWGGQVVNGVWLAYWMTMKGYRSGIGALLMRKITEMFPIVAGQGASLMNQEIVTVMGFKFLEKIPKVVFVFNHKKICDAFHFETDNSPVRDLEEYRLPESPIDITKENFNPKWVNYPSLNYATLRDSEYLAFRYIDYPFFKYYVFIEGGPVSPVVCVARIVDTTAGLRVARILEFFFPENASGRERALSLARKSLNFFKRQNCDYSDFYCNAPAYMTLLREAGFVDDNEGNLPSLLDPIDMSRRFQNMEVFVSPELRKQYPNSENEFVVTRADGDQDRPNVSCFNARTNIADKVK